VLEVHDALAAEVELPLPADRNVDRHPCGLGSVRLRHGLLQRVLRPAVVAVVAAAAAGEGEEREQG
jgi:hypothetical protein